MSTQHTAALVAAARAGDPRAQDELVGTHLPLVYNIVGRALNGSCDVDDVVQDTMLRALDGLGGLRADESFRSWLVAIAMNRVRAYWQARQSGYGESTLEAASEVADPGADFVDLTVVRLNLAGQRRETARATRWLEPDDRALLSLWWLECAGELTRAEVAAALELSTQHAAVRVQRMKAQLEAARVVVRALDARPVCEELRTLTAGWDGRPSALWRKRIARHARECVRCSGLWSGLVPAEGLLAGLALVPVSAALLAGVRAAGAADFTPAGAAFAEGDGAGSGFADTAAHTHLDPEVATAGGGRSALRRRKQNRRRVIGGAVLAACVAGGGLVYLGTLPGSGDTKTGEAAAPAPLAALSASESALPSEPPSPSASPRPPRPLRRRPPPRRARPRARPRRRAAAAPRPRSPRRRPPPRRASPARSWPWSTPSGRRAAAVR